jgi:hypothetical protein
VPAWRTAAAATIAAELGTTDTSWIEWNEAMPAAGADLQRVILSAVGHAASADRVDVLRQLASGLAPGAVAVVIDHNRPRRLLSALAAVVGAPRLPGASPVGRWRRLAHPTARELQAAGFDVERLRFVAGERVQIVMATVAPPRAGGSTRGSDRS